MKNLLGIFALLATLASGPAFAGCSPFAEGLRPSIPDGEQATETEMFIAQESTKLYVAAVADHLDCSHVRGNPLKSERIAARAFDAARTYNRELAEYLRRDGRRVDS